MNTTIDFSTAKLLKEKGFNEPCRFVHDNWNNIEDWYDIGREYHRNSEKNASVYYSAPTIVESVMWLYKKHGIWVWVEKQYNPIYFRPVVDCISPNSKTHRLALYLHTPTEAYTAAIEYTLLNLI
jgi:hypothetical protein